MDSLSRIKLEECLGVSVKPVSFLEKSNWILDDRNSLQHRSLVAMQGLLVL